jgi:hypothetical protein
MNNLHKIRRSFDDTILSQLWAINRSLNRFEHKFNIWIALDMINSRVMPPKDGLSARSPMYYREIDERYPWTNWYWENDKFGRWIGLDKPAIDFTNIQIHDSRPEDRELEDE